jgi:hypothetical protein
MKIAAQSFRDAGEELDRPLEREVLVIDDGDILGTRGD